MKIYWSSNSIPELQGFDKNIQNSWSRQAYKASLSNPRIWLSLGLMLIINLIAFNLVMNARIGLGYSMLINGSIAATTVFLNNQNTIRLIRLILAQYRTTFEQTRTPDRTDYYVPHAFK